MRLGCSGLKASRLGLAMMSYCDPTVVVSATGLVNSTCHAFTGFPDLASQGVHERSLAGRPGHSGNGL